MLAEEKLENQSETKSSLVRTEGGSETSNLRYSTSKSFHFGLPSLVLEGACHGSGNDWSVMKTIFASDLFPTVLAIVIHREEHELIVKTNHGGGAISANPVISTTYACIVHLLKNR
jgi:hypothetical protein